MAQIRIKAGTRAQLDDAAIASGLAEREPYFITDEDRFAVGTAANAYQAFAKEGEGGGASLPNGTAVGQVPTWDGDSWEPTLPSPKITVSSTEPSDPSVGDIWISF